MGGGIAQFDDAVATGRQNCAIVEQNSAHRHLATRSGGFGFGERKCYGFVIIHRTGTLLARDTTKKPRKSATKFAMELPPTGGFAPEIGAIPASESDDGEERIAKRIARAGICSRRDAEKLIAEGRVTLNGEKVTTPATKVDAYSLITVNGKQLAEPEPARLWRFHKPAGLVTTHKDPGGRPTVFQTLPKGLPRVVSVGRLDVNTEGLLLLTNDGELARKLELPSGGWQRQYRVRLFGEIKQETLDTLAEGVTIDGVRYGPVIAKLERSKGIYSWATVTIHEGKNREVKRIMESLNLKVARLIRVQFGPFHLGQLAEGAVEEISSKLWREQLGMASRKTRKER